MLGAFVVLIHESPHSSFLSEGKQDLFLFIVQLSKSFDLTPVWERWVESGDLVWLVIFLRWNSYQEVMATKTSDDKRLTRLCNRCLLHE